ncbi:Crp/Fnr family transcriptional regulator [Methylobacterium platani]|uniref:Cyclic nucleotide-binding protein n=2 Tax=Methylobacterium platani TaxID=427683 RepID=A0A179SDT7_9HYPH|nr:Crp/Fnr family transcriptional regulator [Methylobacterium platani]KMO12495.1 cyclic nucleotide-binding protein [Methylobacterium platani JCM 14648]OAS24649.1 cyclic nucleotide-binding protein [Methylobacterium platani]
MAEFLIRKLEHFTSLSSEDKHALDQAARQRTRRIRSRDDIVHEGDVPQGVNLIVDGWACRYKTLEDGRRQIIAYLLPGDLCDHNVSVLREMDHSIGTVTAVTLAEIPAETMRQLTSGPARLSQALCWESMVAAAIQREWTVNIGQRTAFERLGHLLCELYVRLRTVGLVQGNTCELPLTQAEIADTIGLSVVHVNRTLQELRSVGLISLRGRELTIHRLDALQRAVQFNPNYLHLGREGRHLDSNEA